jgi:hypothetical protein
MSNQVNIQEPQQRRAMPVAGIRAITGFSSICLFLAIAGFIGSGIVLQNAHGAQALLVGSLIGIGSSTLIALLCAASVGITTLLPREIRSNEAVERALQSFLRDTRPISFCPLLCPG